MHLKTILTGWLRRSAALLLGAAIATSAVAATDTTTYFHNDVSGTPMLATDATGQIIWKEAYRPYGEKLTNSPAGANNKMGFAGKPYDGNTGLSYMGARYYDPVVGRFTGIDPKEVDPIDLHSFNRYAYANNNPYKFVDPDGRSPLLVFAPLVAWATGGAVISGSINASWQFATSGQVRWGGVGGVVDAAGDGAILGPGLAVLAARGSPVTLGASVESVSAKELSHPTFRPGPFASESLPARSSARDFTAVERAEGKRIFAETGCHTCGTKNPGTKSGNPVLDHQPVSSLNRDGAPQRLYPQCLSCSREQGLAAARELRKTQE
jgi:RHS repeat-associated protein